MITQPARGWQGWGLNLTSSNSKSHALSEHTLLRIYLHPPPNLVSKILTTSISKYWLMMHRLEGIRKLVQGKRSLHEEITASSPEQSFERLSNRGLSSRKITDHFSPQKADCSNYTGSKREQVVHRWRLTPIHLDMYTNIFYLTHSLTQKYVWDNYSEETLLFSILGLQQGTSWISE